MNGFQLKLSTVYNICCLPLCSASNKVLNPNSVPNSTIGPLSTQWATSTRERAASSLSLIPPQNPESDSLLNVRKLLARARTVLGSSTICRINRNRGNTQREISRGDLGLLHAPIDHWIPQKVGQWIHHLNLANGRSIGLRINCRDYK